MEDPAGFVPPVADEDRFPVVEAALKKQRMSGLDIFRLDVTKKYKNMIMSHNLRLNLTDKLSILADMCGNLVYVEIGRQSF